jgi:DNA-directed RNA polymerase specialized sigma24 family protein
MSDISDRKCEGCGTPLPHADPRRIWCSERCRKQTRYSHPCVDCEKPLNGSDGHSAKAAVRCVRCAALAAVPREVREREEAVLRMRAEGMLNYEIAHALECTPSTVGSLVSNMRKRGRNVPVTAYYPSAARSRP